MRRLAYLLVASPALWTAPATAREAVAASPPQELAVTLYRDPHRGQAQQMNRDWPQGFAMISETRQVTLPPGESTVRFEGVAEGMVAVTAIVTGLPGGTIEKNRNADLLSPGALVDGTLGNRITITRTNPATGAERSESAIVRTRADGGLVLQTADGFEAVRCSGLPEKLTFDRVPAGLSAQPVFTVDTHTPAGGTYTVTLTYLASGFDWQAHYVATLGEGGKGDDMRLRLMSWLTLLNDNGQSFPDAELMVVAGKLNVESDYRALADPPDAEPLRLVCYPLGSTAAGTAVGNLLPPPPAPPPPPAMAPQAIVVTGARAAAGFAAREAMVAVEEALGDLKLYRVPEPVTVSAKGLKQVAFLDRGAVRGKLIYETECSPWTQAEGFVPVRMRFETVNDKAHGLGVALPMGGVTFFEPGPYGELFVGEQQLRDHAEGQDVELELGASSQVFAACAFVAAEAAGRGDMKATLTNANPASVTVRLKLGPATAWTLSGLRGTRLKDGEAAYEFTVPANGRRELTWQVREPDAAG